MQRTIYYPCKALQPYISHYRIWNLTEPTSMQNSFQDYPRTIMDMLFLLTGEVRISLDNARPFRLSDCSFIGQFDKNYTVFPEGSLQFINVRFKPNGVYPLTKIPLSRLLNKQLSSEHLMGKQINNIHEQVLNESTDLGKIKVIENYLLGGFQNSTHNYKLDQAIGFIQQHQGLTTVKSLSEKLFTNYKSLDRLFQKNIGLSPKKFMQLTRFKHIIDNLENQKTPDWMQFVVDYNFHDQAHFIKEFKQFAGVTPSLFQKSQTIDNNNEFKYQP